MLRYLTERLPVMVTPRWVRNSVQPIAIGDVLRYLVACADRARIPAGQCRAFDIGGPDVLTYADMMRRYAAVAGLRPRLIVPLRPLSPQLSAHWVGLVTPVPSAIARPLVASLVQEAVCREQDIGRYVPDPLNGLTGVDEAIQLALSQTHEADVPTRWSTAHPARRTLSIVDRADEGPHVVDRLTPRRTHRCGEAVTAGRYLVMRSSTCPDGAGPKATVSANAAIIGSPRPPMCSGSGGRWLTLAPDASSRLPISRMHS
jgi:hypothetical protein